MTDRSGGRRGRRSPGTRGVDWSKAFAIGGDGVPVARTPAQRARWGIHPHGQGRGLRLLRDVHRRPPPGWRVKIAITRDTPIELEVNVTGSLTNLKTAGSITLSHGKLGQAQWLANNIAGQVPARLLGQADLAVRPRRRGRHQDHAARRDRRAVRGRRHPVLRRGQGRVLRQRGLLELRPVAHRQLQPRLRRPGRLPPVQRRRDDDPGCPRRARQDRPRCGAGGRERTDQLRPRRPAAAARARHGHQGPQHRRQRDPHRFRPGSRRTARAATGASSRSSARPGSRRRSSASRPHSRARRSSTSPTTRRTPPGCGTFPG